MRSRLREALARLWPLWRQRAPVAVKTTHDEGGIGSAEARARFWAEFRAGQREAEALRSRSR